MTAGSIVGRSLPYVLLTCGGLGFLAAFVLTLERLELAEDDSYVPTCSINPIVSCGSVMKSEQASLFGFPNPLIGIAAFAVLLTIGMALLAGARPRAWFWHGLQIGALLGVVFVHWLIFQSLYRIGALCPYCMVVWVVTVVVFWYVSLANVEAGRIRVSEGLGRVAVRYHTVVVMLWVLAVAGLIVARFWTNFTMMA
ncbi:vitamin K epoxide reductase family protein [Nonomuraea sp. NPDC046802]|uniref:vitamin K epoxide reductase family protein n=1 Tax=Nonomuraea sp. NPDC046802 TaxID=3154919 RepID=UPI0033C2BD14